MRAYPMRNDRDALLDCAEFIVSLHGVSEAYIYEKYTHAYALYCCAAVVYVVVGAVRVLK